MRLGRERPRKDAWNDWINLEAIASMRLGRERPRKVFVCRRDVRGLPRFNEAGARTPQKARRMTVGSGSPS